MGFKRYTSFTKGFTLIEMVVVAPIVILAIGTFITLIISLTGEVISSRGSNVLTYNIQDTLNRMEQDVKLSASFLATNSVSLTSSNPQGRGSVNSITDFKAVDEVYGQALILSVYATNGNPTTPGTSLVYLADKPSDCSDYSQYSHNTPLIINVVYFVDNAGTLWRRTIMPSDYNDPSKYCGSVPWQQPSCIDDASRDSFCVTNDEKMVDHVGILGLSIQYFTAASDTTPLVVSDSTTNVQLEPATTVSVSITAKTNLAGRDVTRNGIMRMSRIDTNAASVSGD